MTTPSDGYFWAIYDEYDFKLRGGFQSKALAEHWLRTYPPYVVWDEAGNEIRVGTQYEVDLIRTQYPNILIKPADLNEYRVLVETD